MSVPDERISINVTIDIPLITLQTVVENAKKLVGPDDKGIYRVDPAEKMNELVSAFLKKYAFEEFVTHMDHYESAAKS